jgi:hypothetical protein
MQAVLNGDLNIFVVMIFPILLLCGFIMKRVVFGIRGELALAKYQMERGPLEEAPKPPPKELALPGYTWLTQADYDELVAQITAELRAAQSESRGTP